jgi:hypothetical protein
MRILPQSRFPSGSVSAYLVRAEQALNPEMPQHPFLTK